MEIARLHKKVRRTQGLVEEEQESNVGMRSMWNTLVLREGDCVGEGLELGQDQGSLSNRYTTAGFLKLAWQAVGKQASRPAGQVDIFGSHRCREAGSTLAMLAARAMTEAATDIMMSLGSKTDIALLFDRMGDATPSLLRFGCMQEVLEPCAR